MSHTVYKTCTSKFKVKDSSAFIVELLRRNVFPYSGDEVSPIDAGYFFNPTEQTFVVSGSFYGGVIGEFDPETDDLIEESLTSLIMEHIDGSSCTGDIVSVITTFTEFRGSLVVNTGCSIDQIKDGVLMESGLSHYTDN